MSSSGIYLLDTNTVSYIAIDRSPAARRTMDKIMRHHSVAISAITEGEVLFGIANRPSASRLRAAVEFLFPRLQILPWDSAAACSYGTVRAQLTNDGKPLAPLDMLIAAHAISVDATFVTHDRAFHQVAALRSVVDWATDLS